MDETTCVSVRGGTGGFGTTGIVAPAEVTIDSSLSLTNNLLEFDSVDSGDGRLPSALSGIWTLVMEKFELFL
jgi:hypothetical protein